MANGNEYILNIDFMRYTPRDKDGKATGGARRLNKGNELTGITFTAEELKELTSGTYPTLVKKETETETETEKTTPPPPPGSSVRPPKA